MDGIFTGIVSALWLGILTSISPCPLATNVAAISFLSKKVIHPKVVFLSGLSYTAGRMFSYAGLGFIIINSFLSVPILANFLQKYMNKAFGPILIVTGLCLLLRYAKTMERLLPTTKVIPLLLRKSIGVFKFNMPSFAISEKHQMRLASSGVGGSFILGLIFALVFCPVSAALFFCSLIPISLNNKIGTLLPFVYGIGTGLPVLLFSFLIALGVTSLSRLFNWLTRLEYFMRKVTGVIFVLVGLYYVGIYLFKIL